MRPLPSLLVVVMLAPSLGAIALESPDPDVVATPPSLPEADMPTPAFLTLRVPDPAYDGPFIDWPIMVDEDGDTMTGDLGFAAGKGVAFPVGRLTGDVGPGLFFGGAAVCLANAGISGCNGGDITAANAGTGLSGGGLSGDVTLSADTAFLQRRVGTGCAAGSSIRVIAQDGGVTCEADDDTTFTAGAGLALDGTTFAIAAGGVTSGMVLDGTLASADLGDDVITTPKLAGDAVTSAKILDATIVAADVDGASIQRRVTGSCAAGSAVRVIGQDGTVTCEAVGDITGVTAGEGLSGGGASGEVTLALVGAGFGTLGGVQAKECEDGFVLTTIAEGTGELLCTVEGSWSWHTVPRANAIRLADGSANDVGTTPSLTIGADGLAVISYYDSTARSLKVAKCGNLFCDSGNTITTVDDPANTVGLHSSIAIGTNRLPVISYHDSTALSLKVVKCGNAACSANNVITTVDDPANNVGLYSSIAIGADGFPVVSYHDATAGTLKVAKCVNQFCSSGNVITTVDDPANTVGRYTSIAIGTNGFPVISYHDATAGSLKFAKCGNAACSASNVNFTLDDPANTVGQYSSIAIGADGFPVISYYDATGGNLKVAKCGGPSCSFVEAPTITHVDADANVVGRYTSIAIGTDGSPVISYHDATAGSLKVAKCGDAACSASLKTAVDDPSNIVGEGTGIAIGTDGLPVIAYRDDTAGNLKFVHLANPFGINNWWRRG